MAVDRQLQMAELLSVAKYIKAAPIGGSIQSLDSITVTKTKADVVHALKCIGSIGIVAVGQNPACGKLGKLAEGLLYILQVLKIIQMVRLNI